MTSKPSPSSPYRHIRSEPARPSVVVLYPKVVFEFETLRHVVLALGARPFRSGKHKQEFIRGISLVEGILRVANYDAAMGSSSSAVTTFEIFGKLTLSPSWFCAQISSLMSEGSFGSDAIEVNVWLHHSDMFLPFSWH